MYILSVIAKSKRNQNSDFSHNRANHRFFIQATLKCPVCKAEVEISTPELKLVLYDKFSGTLTAPEQYASCATEALCATRTCENCGTVSAAPVADRERVRAKLREIITHDWIRDQLGSDSPSALAI